MAGEKDTDLGRHILHLTGMLSLKYGGMERYLLELTRQCREKGYKTYVQYEALPESAEYVSAIREAGAELLVQPLNSSFWSGFKGVQKVFREARPEIVQTHFLSTRMMPIAYLAGKSSGVQRRVSMVHNLGVSTSRLWNRTIFFGWNHVLGVSSAVAQSLIAGGLSRDRVRVHYMGLIDPPGYSDTSRNDLRKELGIPSDAVVFGTIAFRAAFKGVDVLLAAFAKLLERCPSAYLIQIGIDPSKYPLAQRYAHLKNIHWLGIRDNAAAILSGVDIYIQPSRSAEGLPLAIMEAMAAKRPVLATFVSGNSEAILDGINGICVQPESVDALAEGMMKLGYECGPDRLRDMGEAGFERFSAMFDGRESVRRLIETYYCS